MKLIINPKTERGGIQLETIKWCEDQVNEFFLQYFNNKYKIMKGLRFNFKIGLDLKLDNIVKAEVAVLEPDTKERFEFAVKESKSQLQLKEGGDKNGTNKKEFQKES
jgi:hypothetical protein